MKGAAAEDLALSHLEAQGLALVARNLRVPGGELDLVMRDGPQLVIVEVRKRSSSAFGSAFESVDARKQQRLIHATRALLSRRDDLAGLAVRFDVVALDGRDQIQWLRAAFDAD